MFTLTNRGEARTGPLLAFCIISRCPTLGEFVFISFSVWCQGGHSAIENVLHKMVWQGGGALDGSNVTRRIQVVTQRSSWHWPGKEPPNSHCPPPCLFPSSRCTVRWMSRPRWTVRLLPRRNLPGCRHCRPSWPCHWMGSGCPSGACDPPYHWCKEQRQGGGEDITNSTI